MNSATTRRFREAFARLTPEIQKRARKAYSLWKRDHSHPSIHFKKTGLLWSARVDDSHRALGEVVGDTVYWLWIGPHDQYEQMLANRKKL